MPSLSSFGSLSTRLLGGVTPTISPTFESRVIAAYWNDADTNFPIYYTDDYGNNWTATQFYKNETYDMASNGNGDVLSVGGNGGQGQPSTSLSVNNGNTWPVDTLHNNLQFSATSAIWNNLNGNFLFMNTNKVFSTINGIDITLLATLFTNCKLSSNGSRIVAVGRRYSAYSINGGVSWQGNTNSILNFPNQFLFLNNTFIVVDNTTIIKTSNDGVTWSQQTTNLPTTIISICWDGTQYVALTVNGRCMYSNNLTTWNYIPFPAITLDINTVNPKIVYNGQNYMFADGANSVISFNSITSDTVSTTTFNSPASLGYATLLVIRPNVPSNT